MIDLKTFVEIGFKRCRKCGILFPRFPATKACPIGFYKHLAMPDGLMNICVKCSSEKCAARPVVTYDRAHELLHYYPSSGFLFWRSTGELAGNKSRDGYVQVCIDGRPYKAHRLIWFMVTGYWPTPECDHIDLDRSNNRWSNLRQATHKQNHTNTPANKNNKLGVKGVYKIKNYNKYVARIRVNGIERYLGLFNTIHEAQDTYAKAAREFFGEFARVV